MLSRAANHWLSLQLDTIGPLESGSLGGGGSGGGAGLVAAGRGSKDRSEKCRKGGSINALLPPWPWPPLPCSLAAEVKSEFPLRKKTTTLCGLPASQIVARVSQRLNMEWEGLIQD